MRPRVIPRPLGRSSGVFTRSWHSASTLPVPGSASPDGGPTSALVWLSTARCMKQQSSRAAVWPRPSRGRVLHSCLQPWWDSNRAHCSQY
ncbi:hypothetical protein K505DRAFT_326810 [Melanomma pulvis-pyrius CBS 109.77]|uniref:Uncharacterized protein n=1 Tax=Melanomma pulvis-pyrius CBS 109.77 TaxID=1314802 RepID=A0A6A6X5X5_9PLEO|nr:hypothetical protein K505DRAFT_326810 [Melanomma pulvis-pyrius CBS 109.77]